ncbi:alpha/beta hydrolase [Flavobacterium jejuense]|uniref:Alpha/beta hydrolase n=1 Tax=Flavobacterium jejuense TaxID=1544455 RepID=A0ABX0ITW1_9FLAO|nr:alpha/beta hydrolase-fold protein [Flavobacterium jejuense]NHN26247.1 alpha/beta hydrolase [Flavobacterium jejuense]
MEKSIAFILLAIFVIPSTIFSQETKKEFSIGETVTITSKILSQDRILNIYLPEGYKKNDSIPYPVIYLLDGSSNEDFLHVTGLVQFFNLQLGMPKTIIVGIANKDRKHDFTYPTEIPDLKKDFPTTGGSEKFINFIAEELQPFITKNYKVSDKKYILGQSLGGLLAAEILFKKPELFTHYFIISPSLWWDDESLLHNASNYLSKIKKPIYVYVAVGEEHKVMIKDAKTLASELKKYPNTIKTNFHFFSKENHATILHNSLYQAFLLEFPYKEPK